jgi:hypothetical protein
MNLVSPRSVLQSPPLKTVCDPWNAGLGTPEYVTNVEGGFMFVGG